MTWERDFGCVTGRDKGINANVLDHHPEIRDSVGFGGGVAYIYIYVYIYIYIYILIYTLYICIYIWVVVKIMVPFWVP